MRTRPGEVRIDFPIDAPQSVEVYVDPPRPHRIHSQYGDTNWYVVGKNMTYTTPKGGGDAFWANGAWRMPK